MTNYLENNVDKTKDYKPKSISVNNVENIFLRWRQIRFFRIFIVFCTFFTVFRQYLDKLKVSRTCDFFKNVHNIKGYKSKQKKIIF